MTDCINQTTLLSIAPTDSETILLASVGSTTLLQQIIQATTLLSLASTDSETLITDSVGSTTELCI